MPKKLTYEWFNKTIFDDDCIVHLDESAKKAAFNYFMNVFFSDEEGIHNYIADILDGFGYGAPTLTGDGFNRSSFFRGSMPVCLVAHTDTVYKNDKRTACAVLKSIVCNKNDDGTHKITSGMKGVGIGADDRLGIVMILSILRVLHMEGRAMPSVFFPSGEEIGCLGTKFFTGLYKDFPTNVNCFIQFDRRGSDDVVRYSDDNLQLTEAVERFGFKRAFGSCTDISDLMPAYNTSGVNVSCGYYNEHSSEDEYFIPEQTIINCRRVLGFLRSEEVNIKYSYKENDFDSWYGNYYGGKYGGYLTPAAKSNLSKLASKTQSSYPKCRDCKQPIMFERYNVVRYDYNDKIYVSKVCSDCADELFYSGAYYMCPKCDQYTLIEKGISYCPICKNHVEDPDADDDTLPF